MKKNKKQRDFKKMIRDFFIKDDEIEEDIEEQSECEVKLTGFRLFEVVILIIIATVIGVFSGSFLTYNYGVGTNKRYFSKDYIDEFREAYQNILDNYYEDVDKEKLIDAAIKGMMSTLDGYTSYMTPEETKQFNESMEGEYEGIGIEFTTEVGYIHNIISVFEGSPAAVVGIKAGDKLIRVDNMDAATMTGPDIATYIRGKNISEVTLVINRDGKDIKFVVSKDVISLPSVEKETYEFNGKKVGYINISLFADNTATQFKEALVTLENNKINSLIIDVRSNSGGYLHVATDIIEMFLSKGNIVYQTENKLGVIKYTDQTAEKRTYPVAVLTNGCSASASEVLTAAFKEVYGAQIIGTTSYGKGTIQQPNGLTSGGMLKVTTGKWLTPKGIWIDKVGIRPTIEVEMNEDSCMIPSFDSDNQLQKALEVITK
ncbi:MAG: S41 family peptidase [Bacilli bacterium]|nr:S41 family peptidase [Bacilli bacterium]MDD4643848.1 S41 family peptidase [Bacilli bacterium]